MVLAAAGAVDHEQLVKEAEATFGSVPDETPDTSVAALVAKVGRSRRLWWAHTSTFLPPPSLSLFLGCIGVRCRNSTAQHAYSLHASLSLAICDCCCCCRIPRCTRAPV
jgi:predicted Zn-dependent peptidase